LFPSKQLLGQLPHWDGTGSLSAGCRYETISWKNAKDRLPDYERTGVPEGAGREGGFDLGRMHRLLRSIGDPHLSFPAVQVVGTKGKGSTSALLSNILRASGYNVGTYASPHVAHEAERISCGTSQQYISPAALEELKERHFACVAELGEPLSHFEVFTAAAFKYFQDQKVDIAVVEAGLGGLTDATNVFPPPGQLLSIVTAVGMDHRGALGNTITEIATVKAGILKEGRPVVLGMQPNPEAAAAVNAVAHEKGCPVLDCSMEMIVVPHGMTTLSSGRRAQRIDILPTGDVPGFLAVSDAQLRLLGSHQQSNAAAAVRASWQLAVDGWKITPETIRKGLLATSLPGRLEILSGQVGGRGTQHLVLDAAHTPESAEALVQGLREAFPGQPTVIVLAMLNDKDIRGFVKAIRKAIPKVIIFTTSDNEGTGMQSRAANSGTLSAAWQLAAMEDRSPDTRRLRTRELVQASMEAAMAKALDEAQAIEGGAIICVTGSFTAVRAAMTTNTFLDYFRHSQA